MNVQYVGFSVTPTARIYSFHVIDSPQESREFVVRLKAAVFRSTPLKYQQGPEICLLRLKRELAAETEAARGQQRLEILETDIHEYLQRHPPRKRS